MHGMDTLWPSFPAKREKTAPRLEGRSMSLSAHYFPVREDVMGIRSGRSPGLVQRFPPFPAFASGLCGSLPITVARPRRILTGFPIKAECHLCGVLFSLSQRILWCVNLLVKWRHRLSARVANVFSVEKETLGDKSDSHARNESGAHFRSRSMRRLYFPPLSRSRFAEGRSVEYSTSAIFT